MVTGTTDQRELRDKLSMWAVKYGFKETDLSRGLEGYAAHLFIQETGFEELLEGRNPEDRLDEFILRSDDLEADIVLDDEVNKQMIIAQSAYINPKGRLPEQKAEAFFACLHRLRDPAFLERGGDQVRDLLGNLGDKLRDGYTVALRFVTSLRVPDDHRLRIAANAQQAAYERDGYAVLCEIVDKPALKDLERQIVASRQGYLSSVEFKVQRGQYIEVNGPRHSLICRISGNELRNLYGQYGPQLFNLNIRLPMAADRGINKEIRETADSDPQDFFYFNNGVSAICSDFDIDGTRVTARRFQVINGAQTIGSLARAKTRAQGLYVLFRVSATEETTGGAFTDKVIKFNNSQNPVKISDFRANDVIQAFIKDQFDRWSGKGPLPPLRYQPKRGSRAKSGHRTVSSDEFARIRHAYLYGPVESYKRPKEFWNTDTAGGGRYAEAFGIDGLLRDSWPDQEVMEAMFAVAVHEYVKAQATERKKAERGKIDPSTETRYLYRLARYVTALVGVGLAQRRESRSGDEGFTYAALLGSESQFRTVVEPLMRTSRRLLLSEYNRRLRERPDVQPEYNLARDETAWAQLSFQLREEIKADLT